VSSGEVIAGVTSVAAPIAGAYPAAIAVLFVDVDGLADIGADVRSAALAITRRQR